MWEIERYIGNGTTAAFFRVRGHPSIGVKILFAEDQNIAKRILQTELSRANILRELGVSILNYQDIIQLKIPEHIDQTLNKSYEEMAASKIFYKTMKDFFIKHKGKIVWGLVMEYIPDDAVILKKNGIGTIVSKKRLDYIYTVEKDKLKKLGISIGDSVSDCNIIWSESRAKLYFIDFLNWDLTNVGDFD